MPFKVFFFFFFFVLFFLALATILIIGEEPFLQSSYRAIIETFVRNYYEIGLVV